MQPTASSFTLVVILGAIILLALAFFIVLFLLFFRQKQLKNQAEKIAIQETYERALLQSQLETQNQTLEYLGQELHDNIGQLLSVTMLQLNGLDEDLADPAHQADVRRMIQTIQNTIQAVRQLAKTLDSGTIKRFGLRESLALELERIEHTGRYQTYLHVTGQPYILGDETEIILFRMAQESLNNSLKHSHARTLTVTMDYQPEDFSLTIADNGRGFDLSEATNRSLDTGGSGVNNLYQRAKLLGGTCTIDTLPGSGTSIEIKLPHHQS